MVLRLLPALKVAIMVLVLTNVGSVKRRLLGLEALERCTTFFAASLESSKSGRSANKPFRVSGTFPRLINSISNLSGIRLLKPIR